VSVRKGLAFLRWYLDNYSETECSFRGPEKVTDEYFTSLLRVYLSCTRSSVLISPSHSFRSREDFTGR
jgi:hypothetical protein